MKNIKKKYLLIAGILIGLLVFLTCNDHIKNKAGALWLIVTFEAKEINNHRVHGVTQRNSDKNYFKTPCSSVSSVVKNSKLVLQKEVRMTEK